VSRLPEFSNHECGLYGHALDDTRGFRFWGVQPQRECDVPVTQDQLDAQLCIWKEARGEGHAGMLIVGCVIRNRAIRHRQTWGQVVWKKWAFSSMTDPNDPQFHKKAPEPTDVEYPSYVVAGQIVQDLTDPAAQDITKGATLYYDCSISFPKSWNKNAVVPLGKIGRLNLFREIQGGTV
jgi:hypothetical protein